MAYYLSRERNEDVFGSFRRYQDYLREYQDKFPPNAFALAKAEWYQNPQDHRCPHDGWLERITISEPATGQRCEERITSIQIRLLGAYHDGFIELFYPQVFNYSLNSPSCANGLGDWICDEFRLSANGHLIHEIEWSDENGPRWIIEASDIEFKWIPK